MPNWGLGNDSSDDVALIGRAANVPPAEEPFGTEALDELCRNRLGRFEFGFDW